MRRVGLLLSLLLGALVVPVQASIDAATASARDERLASGVPLGGIGTGKVEILSDGTFGNLTLNNNWSRPIAELPASFFAIRAATEKKTTARVLALHSPYKFPTVAGVRYQGAFPKARLEF